MSAFDTGLDLPPLGGSLQANRAANAITVKPGLPHRPLMVGEAAETKEEE